MAENQEQIESRLCGYVDDTLDATERAEIEAHLDAHPQHRQLLVQLRQMRDALAALPRESAPAELGESFSGQLERSVLLDGLTDPPSPQHMRIGRAPQLAAAAAILLLAGGLGLFAYFAFLRSPQQMAQNGHPSVVATNPPPAVALAFRDRTTQPQESDQMASAKPVDQFPPPPSPLLAPAAGSTGNIGAGASPILSPPTPMVEGARVAPGSGAHLDAEQSGGLALAAGSVLSNEQVRSLLGQAEPADDRSSVARPTVVMVVSTDDAGAVTRRVGNYLETSNADWQPAPSADNLAAADERAFGHGIAAPAVGGAMGNLADGSLQPMAPGDKFLPTTQPRTQPAVAASGSGSRMSPAAPGKDALDEQSLRTALMDKAMVPTTNAQNAVQTPAANADRLGNRVYVVRNLSFQQATQLSESVSRIGNTQAPLFAENTVDAAAENNASREMQRQADNPLFPATQSTTQPRTAQQPINDDASRARYAFIDAKNGSRQSAPQTAPANASREGVVPLTKQALLGSSPVDLVILIQDTPIAAPAAAASTLPATFPSTQPTTQP